MRILFLFTYNKGLLSNFFMDLGHRLIEENHEVKIYSLKKHPQKFNKGGVEIIIEKNGGYIKNYNQIFKIIRSTAPDAIISNFSYANPALLAGKILDIKHNIVWVHSLKKHGDPWKYQIYLKGLFYKFATTVIVNSFILKKELKETFKVRDAKMTAIPFWSNIEKIDRSEIIVDATSDSYKIGCPGRFTQIKNQRIIIEAVNHLKQAGLNDIEIYFAGEGPTYGELQKIALELDLVENINFLGVLSKEQMVEFYYKMDVVVLPSLYESFGLVFIESIALNVPVIVSSKFGALDFIEKTEEIKEIIFDPKDSEQLANKILDLRKTSKKRSNFYRNIYKTYFDKNLILKQVLEVLKS